MFKHPACGGTHETVNDARQCERTNGAIRSHLQTPANQTLAPVSEKSDEVWPWAEPTAKTARPAPKRFEDRNRTKGDLDKRNGMMPLGMAYAYALKGEQPPAVTEPEFIAPPVTVEPVPSEWQRGPVETPACSGRNSETTRRPLGQATEAQERFVRILLEERDWDDRIHPQSANGEAISDLGNGETISFSAARTLIELLKTFPKAQDLTTPVVPSAKPSQPWKLLAEEVPAGNYCVEAEDGKRHFYRVSVSDKGFYKLQERASEELHFIPLGRYAGILKTIVEEGVEKARLAYSTHMKRCWKCGIKLTDNTGNPYYSQGLGPDCGAQ